MCASWIDNLCIENEDIAANQTKKLKERFDIDDIEELKEYLGCKIKLNHQEQSLKFTQPVLLQSFKDKFELSQKKPTMHFHQVWHLLK